MKTPLLLELRMQHGELKLLDEGKTLGLDLGVFVPQSLNYLNLILVSLSKALVA